MGLSGLKRTLSDGEVLFHQGDAAADVYVVLSGAIDIVRDTGHGPVVLERVEPGGVFGEMGLFSPAPRSASAVAIGETDLEVIDLPTFQAYVDPVVWGICARMAERCRRADERADTTE